MGYLGYYARVDAFIDVLPWDAEAQDGESELIDAVAAELDRSAIDAFVVALDAEALGYAELMPPERMLERRPGLYRVRLTAKGHARCVELAALVDGQLPNASR